MRCEECGANNEDNVLLCANCGSLFHEAGQFLTHDELHIRNYLPEAILCTLLCCPPFGISALIFATQVRRLLKDGNVRGAIESSKKARMWCRLSVGVVVAFLAILLLAIAVGGLFGSN